MNVKNFTKKLSPVKPGDMILHPLWIISLFLLIFNDHYLKGSSFTGLVSGKISDFAGLIIFPPLLAIVFGVKRFVSLLSCYIFSAAFFSAVKISAFFKDFVCHLMSAMGMAWHITLDSTDLLALSVLPVSFYFLTRKNKITKGNYFKYFWTKASTSFSINIRFLKIALAITGILACLATSYVPEKEKWLESFSVREWPGYENILFYDGIFSEPYLYFPDATRQRIIRLEKKNTSGNSNNYFSLNFSKALLYNGQSFVWTSSEAETAAQGGMDSPVDVTLDNEGHIWALDKIQISRFHSETGSLLLTALFPQDVTGVQLEFDESLYLLAKDDAQNKFLVYKYDIAGQRDLSFTYQVADTQKESQRNVTKVIQFKAFNKNFYFIEELEKINPNEQTPFFLERIGANGNFQSGVFLYNASGLSIMHGKLLISGRLRNYSGDVTMLDPNLDPIRSFQLPEGYVKRGVIFQYYEGTVDLGYGNTTEQYDTRIRRNFFLLNQENAPLYEFVLELKRSYE
jgi:hypothetical protein